jgi:opacity protein-like surface antigen
MRIVRLLALCCSGFVLAAPALAASFATQVVRYTAGSNIPASYDDPTSSLGSPLRATGSGPFDGDLGPFNAPYTADQVVSIGAGGELVVRFDHQVADDSANPYGIDLLVYGNAFLGLDFNSGLADGVTFFEPARIAVSQDGTTWFDATVFADALFPTLAYSNNPNGPFGSGGTNRTSYTRPVDPSLSAASFVGLDVNQIAALYGGGGGGVGIDLAALGLPWIEYVRVWQPEGDLYASDIDAFADVPEPGAATLFGVAALALISRRARTLHPSR